MSRPVWHIAAGSVALAAVVGMTGCSKPQSKMPSGNEQKPAISPNVVSEATPPLNPRNSGLHPTYDCSGVKPAAAQPGSPADDILGVRLGMIPSVVEAELACGNPRYTFERNEGPVFEMPAVEHGRLPLTDVGAQLDGDTVDVMFLGLAGKEQAARLTRQIRYPTGSLTSFLTELQSLTAKYGPPTSDTGLLRDVFQQLEWIYTPSGSPMNSKAPNYTGCENVVGYGSAFAVTSGCGLTIVAHLTEAADGGVAQLDLTVMNQAATLTAMEKVKADIATVNAPTGAPGRL